MLAHAWARSANAFHQAEARQPRRFTNEGDLTQALDEPQLIEDGIQILHNDPRRGGLQLLDKLLLA